MQSYEQIDRKKTAYVQAANKALAALPDTGYRWWNYEVSHCKFSLVVGDPTAEQGNVVILLAACKYISGSVDWFQPHQLEVIFHCDRTKRDVWEFVVQSEAASFRAVAGVFEWRKNFNILERYKLSSVDFDDERKTKEVS